MINCKKILDLYEEAQTQNRAVAGLLKTYEAKQADYVDGQKIEAELDALDLAVKRFESRLLTKALENAESFEVVPDSDIFSKETAISKLTEQGYVVHDTAQEMLGEVDWTKKLADKYEIISISVGEIFGDTATYTYGDIKKKAKELGLELVPQALAPSIREKYGKKDPYTTVAMDNLPDRNGDLHLFRCGWFDSGSWLGSNYGRDDNEWFGNDRFFFARK
jgi:hypothetical protein